MTLLLMGLDYRHTPLALRERLYVSGPALTEMLTALHGDVMDEVIILSTCNRLEVYASVSDVNQALCQLFSALAARAALSVEAVRHRVQVLCDGDAVRHLMRVASGLESLVIGETEILGQMTQALHLARESQTVGAVLSRLFHDALHAGKRARAETEISRHTLSVSHAAVRMAKHHLGDLQQARILVIGAGQMAELTLWALHAQKVTSTRLINRSFARAEALAERFGLEAASWDMLETELARADVVITATSAPQPLLNAALLARMEHPMLLIDIAVPRNISPDVRTQRHVCLYDLDDLQMVVEDHRARRQSEVERVEAIVDEEQAAYLEWLNSRRAIPQITALRQQTEEMAAAELKRALQRLPHLDTKERAVMEQLVHRLVNKFLHGPTTALREQAAHDPDLLLEALVHEVMHD